MMIITTMPIRPVYEDFTTLMVTATTTMTIILTLIGMTRIPGISEQVFIWDTTGGALLSRSATIHGT